MDPSARAFNFLPRWILSSHSCKCKKQIEISSGTSLQQVKKLTTSCLSTFFVEEFQKNVCSTFWPFVLTSINLFLFVQITGACANNRYRCEGGNKCIPLKWICDGVHDCDDKLDERNCFTGNETSIPSYSKFKFQ